MCLGVRERTAFASGKFALPRVVDRWWYRFGENSFSKIAFESSYKGRVFLIVASVFYWFVIGIVKIVSESNGY